MGDKVPNGFFAYSSDPKSIKEHVESAITNINSGGLCHIESWLELEINGKLIINSVLEKVRNADFFCADLTAVNDNVMFELGYAIGLNKKIFVILDGSRIDPARKISELDFLSTLGISYYTLSSDIETAFYTIDIEKKKGALDSLLQGTEKTPETKALLYLKSQVDTNYNEAVLKCIVNAKLDYELDDSSEVLSQPIEWYMKNLLSCTAVLSEFSSSDRVGYQIQNSKCSFISGIALALGVDLLMIAEEPYNTPLDYKDYLIKYNTVNTVTQNVNSFLNGVKDRFFQKREQLKQIVKRNIRKSELQTISFGDFLAEHEESTLCEYYVPLSADSDILKSEYNIIVGRKGSGKSATLLYLKETLSNEKINHVCVIKPISFDLKGLFNSTLQDKDDILQSNLIESMWKLLIYTEIAQSLYHFINEKALYAQSDSDRNFISYINDNSEIF